MIDRGIKAEVQSKLVGIFGRCKDFVKSKRENILTYGEKLDILLIQAKIKLNNLEIKTKSSRGRKVNTVNPNIRTAFLLNRKYNMVVDTWKTYSSEHRVKVAESWNRPDMIGYLRNCGVELILSLRIFLRERRINKTRIIKVI
ncbi:hypothetical protein A3Q56_07613 [Intoshia linei]|uniref:Uncharacterized protein n=1 Tax=Intoshia linei TaxID=1819745 RepID=A0A177ARR9_9BILA|nr:hypothetical protein A3Q56_07613 [Intoshia linei]